MKEKKALLPKLQNILTELGENIKFARLRRNLSAAQIAQRANTSRPTLLAIESGNGSVSISAYIRVLAALGLEGDLLKIAKDDKLGRKLQDANLDRPRKRAAKKAGAKSQ
jgi:transcriptional regulator with XRE-family HTH domain